MAFLYTQKKRLQNRAGNIAFRGLLAISKRLTPKRMEFWSGVLGGLAYRISTRYRTVATRHLTMAFGDQHSPEKIQQMVREVFRNFCRGALEFFYLANARQTDIDHMIDFEGLEHVDAALAKGKGAIVITAHFGNWELMARRVVSMGYPLTVIARDSDDPGMTGIAKRIREGAGYKVLERDRSVRGAVECLRRNQMLGILPDQNTANGGILVDFFGRPATTATGPAIFAIRTGAAVIPAFAPRGEDGKYHCRIYPPIDVQPSGDRDADEAALTAAITQAIEAAIKEHPTQWLWLHDRWKRARELTGAADVG